MNRGPHMLISPRRKTRALIHSPALTASMAGAALRLFSEGKDTVDIAKNLGVHERDALRLLHWGREMARIVDDGNGDAVASPTDSSRQHQ